MAEILTIKEIDKMAAVKEPLTKIVKTVKTVNFSQAFHFTKDKLLEKSNHYVIRVFSTKVATEAT